MNSKADIRLAEPSDIEQIATISNICFGNQYLTKEHVCQQLELHDYNFVVILNETVVGFCFAQQISASYAYDIYEILPKNVNSYAIIKNIAVHPEYQRKKLATKLLNNVYMQLKANKNFDGIFYPCWDEPVSKAFCESLLELGFSKLKEIKDYWLNDSHEKGYDCIKCGNPCKCSLLLYYSSHRYTGINIGNFLQY